MVTSRNLTRGAPQQSAQLQKLKRSLAQVKHALVIQMRKDPAPDGQEDEFDQLFAKLERIQRQIEQLEHPRKKAK